VGATLLAGGLLPRVAEAAPNGFKDHFAIGIAAAPDVNGVNGWMPDSKIPWDYAYQYLSAGVNTGHGWSTWNDQSKFPLFYANSAAAHGYVPAFSYYQLLQSDGPCGGCREGDKDLAHLNDPATMKAYYNDFALLMKRLGPGTYDGVQGFGQTVVVHVEPDLSGYMQRIAQGNDPAAVPAAVASSDVTEVATFPNTYQGFNWALLHLRDLYAPNVQLAFHVSLWATGKDIGTSRDSALDAVTVGANTGAFAAASGVTRAGPSTSTYDLLFSDVLDRDSGFYSYAQNDPNRWWDRLNVTYPNFLRWEQWVAGVVQSAGNKPMVVWQVPIGNQYFQTMNNTSGHYQDNRAEYFFGHLDELRQVGIVGLLFGGGGGGVTTYSDADNDGISNPPAFCTTDGISSGQICNDHPSTVTDDDGGFLRMSAQQYFANPLPLGPAAAVVAPLATTLSRAAPALEIDLGATSLDPTAVTPGQQVSVRQNTITNTDATVLLDFELFDSDGQQVFKKIVPNQRVLVGLIGSTSTAFTVPDDLAPGRYTLKIVVFSNDGRNVYTSSEVAGTLMVAEAPASLDASENSAP
jgi:hypothetical protein